MKTKILIMVIGLCILTIVLSGIQMNYAFKAGPTVCYDGQEKEFVYYNIKDTDLLADLKELMPGDKKEQEIIFQAKNITRNTRFYILINKEEDNSIKQYVKLFVNDKEISDYGEYIQLANFSSDQELKLKVIAEIPKEAGNELEDAKYNMDWNILMQEDGEIIDTPNTYDSTNIYLYIIIIIVSFIIMIYSIKYLYKNS